MTHTYIDCDVSWAYTVNENRQPDNPAATGGTMSCHNDNPVCHRRQPSRQSDDPPSSAMVMDE